MPQPRFRSHIAVGVDGALRRRRGRCLINNPPKFYLPQNAAHRAHLPLAIHSSMMTRASDTFDGTWNSAFSSSPLSTNNART